jgi:integrase
MKVIAIGSGMRKSEQYTLTWPQVDFHRREIHLPKTKNNEAREIPMNSDVLGAFENLRGDRKKPAGRVFAIQDPKGWFESARERSSLKNFRWHDCRHTFCSSLAMAGVPLKTIQVLAGHKTIAITARYAHLAPNTLHRAVELITEAAQAGKKSPEQSATGTATALKEGQQASARA